MKVSKLYIIFIFTIIYSDALTQDIRKDIIKDLFQRRINEYIIKSNVAEQQITNIINDVFINDKVRVYHYKNSPGRYQKIRMYLRTFKGDTSKALNIEIGNDKRIIEDTILEVPTNLYYFYINMNIKKVFLISKKKRYKVTDNKKRVVSNEMTIEHDDGSTTIVKIETGKFFKMYTKTIYPDGHKIITTTTKDGQTFESYDKHNKLIYRNQMNDDGSGSIGDSIIYTPEGTFINNTTKDTLRFITQAKLDALTSTVNRLKIQLNKEHLEDLKRLKTNVQTIKKGFISYIDSSTFEKIKKNKKFDELNTNNKNNYTKKKEYKSYKIDVEVENNCHLDGLVELFEWNNTKFLPRIIIERDTFLFKPSQNAEYKATIAKKISERVIDKINYTILIEYNSDNIGNLKSLKYEEGINIYSKLGKLEGATTITFKISDVEILFK